MVIMIAITDRKECRANIRAEGCAKRKDKRDADPICDVLPFGAWVWRAENATNVRERSHFRLV
jgi:hypothetical protein